MPGLEWLIINEGKTKGNPPKFQEFPHNFLLIPQKRMHDICLLIDASLVLRWAVHFVKLAAVKLQKRG